MTTISARRSTELAQRLISPALLYVLAALGVLCGCVTEQSDREIITFNNGEGGTGGLSIDSKITSLERRVEALPDRIDLRRRLAQLYFEAERYEDALEEIGESIAKDPKNAQLYHIQGRFYLEMSRYADAEASLRHVVTYCKPGFTGPRLTLGYVLAMQEKYEKAIHQFQGVLSLTPNHPTALYYLGCCFDVMGERAKAVAHFEKCAEIEGPYQGKARGELRRLRSLSRSAKRNHFRDGASFREDSELVEKELEGGS